LKKWNGGWLTLAVGALLLAACGEIEVGRPAAGATATPIKLESRALDFLVIKDAKELVFDQSSRAANIKAMPWLNFLGEPVFKIYVSGDEMVQLVDKVDAALVGAGYKLALPEKAEKPLSDYNGTVGGYSKVGGPDLILATYGIPDEPVALLGQSAADFAKEKEQLQGKRSMVVVAAGSWQAFGGVKERARLGTIDYQYTISAQEDGGVNVTVELPLNSADQVRAVALELNRKAEEYGKRGKAFKSELIFARPLPPDEFRVLVKATGIRPLESRLRDTNGGTIGVPPQWAKDEQGRERMYTPAAGGDPLDPGIIARNLPGKKVGVFSAEVDLDKATYAKVRQDGRVFTVDVLPEVMREEVLQRYPKVAPDKIQVQGLGLYEAMERLGIAPKL
jgi:hypothetical protein